MKKSKLVWFLVLPLIIVIVLVYLFLTGERRNSKSMPVRSYVKINLLNDSEVERLGWDSKNLKKVFDFAGSLSTDTLLITTNGHIIGTLGDPNKSFNVHSVRKALLSALIGQHIGTGEKQIPLNATLEELGIDDSPNPLTPLQKKATVLHLLKSMSGINHAAAAEEGLMAEKNRRLGTKENKPGTIWAYNNWDYNVLTTIFEKRTGLSIAEAFKTGIAELSEMKYYTSDTVSYSNAPELSQHRAAMFKMSGRDLLKFGEIYLNKGILNGKKILPESWIDKINSDFAETGIKGLRSGHGYLWWIPDQSTGLPKGSFWAWGLGQQAIFVIPEWNTVIVHQSDTTQVVDRFLKLVKEKNMEAEPALEEIIFGCLKKENKSSEFCVEHRFITRRDFSKLISLIVKARLKK